MQCPWKSEKGIGPPGTGVSDDCQAIWVLGIKPGALGRTANAFSHRGISPTLYTRLYVCGSPCVCWCMWRPEADAERLPQHFPQCALRQGLH